MSQPDPTRHSTHSAPATKRIPQSCPTSSSFPVWISFLYQASVGTLTAVSFSCAPSVYPAHLVKSNSDTDIKERRDDRVI